MQFLKKIFSRKKSGIKNTGEPEVKEGKMPSEEKLNLEKGDLPAMFLAAVLVYGPYFLIFIGALLLLGWVFGAFR